MGIWATRRSRHWAGDLRRPILAIFIFARMDLFELSDGERVIAC